MSLSSAFRAFCGHVQFLHALLLVFIGLIVYSNTFAVPFLFDDVSNIVDNPLVRDLGQFSVPSTYLNSRSIGSLTFAFNYWLHGQNVAGYHVVNVAIHLANSFLVYRLIAAIFQTQYFSNHPRSNCDSQTLSTLARVSSVLFVCHPVQTGAVTYIVQRFTLLATFFYLVSLIMYFAARRYQSGRGKWQSTRFTGFYAGSLLSALLAMRCKEIAFTLPIMIMVTEFLFFEARPRTRIYLLLPFVISMAVIPLPMILLAAPSGGIFQQLSDVTLPSKLITRGDYLLTQSRVVVTYFRLMLFPVGQNVDYDYPVIHSLLRLPALASTVLHTLNALLVIFLLKVSHRDNRLARVVAFGILWFYLTLSMESSIIPLDDVIFEHRLYLPSVGFILCTATCCVIFGKKMLTCYPGIMRIVIMLAVIILAGVAYARNEVWQSGISLWRDAALKSPMKSRPYNNLGLYLSAAGEMDAAIQEFQKALQMNPDFTDAHNNLGMALLSQGNQDAAIQHFEEAIRISPNDSFGHYNLGHARASKGDLDGAIKSYREVLRVHPGDTDARNNLGVALAKKGDLDAAIREYREALRINPDDSDVRNNLAAALAQKVGAK